MGVDCATLVKGGDEGGTILAFVLPVLAACKLGVSTSSSSELSDEDSLSLSLSSLAPTSGDAAREGAADASSKSSSLSDASGVGEWLRKRAGRRETAGEERKDAFALPEGDLETLSSTAVL